jgi:hypothetical protein
MAIEKIFAHLVYPNHRRDVPTPYTASELPLDGKLFGMLKDVYDGSAVECNIDVQFRSSDQTNPMRDLILAFLSKRDAAAAGAIAERLSHFTTGRSQLGLFFVILAKPDNRDCVLFSRFPTEQAILADDGQGQLSVEFLEKVFVKKWSSYKGAIFTDTVSRSGFWEGRVVDRQINAPTGEASKYWVENFLDADFVTTSELGTRRFANALSDASRAASGLEKQEINSMLPFLRQFDGQSVKVDDILQQLGVSPEAKEKILKHMPSQSSGQTFKFQFETLRNSVSFRAVTLDTGVTVTADSVDFQRLVEVERSKEKGGGDIVTLSTTGKLIGDQLRRSR